MSAVKNLRAMFEQKGETSPPDRGRSPGIPLVPGSESPRPLSKVRTSFIAVEKDGRIGLQREGSQDSSLSIQRKLSGESDMATPTTSKELPNPFDSMARTPAKPSLKDQPITESPRTEATSQPPPKFALNVKPQTLTPAPEAVAELDGAAGKKVATGSSTSTEPPQKPEPVKRSSSPEKNGVTKPAAKATASTKPTLKPLAASSAIKSTAKPAKSPSAASAPKSPAVSSAPKLPAKTPEKKAHHPDKPSTPRVNGPTKSAGSVKRPPPLQASPAGPAFVKPKPKSPTRPVKLPSSLTTHTAASGSKIAPRAQSLSRVSSSVHAPESLGRSPSRTSVSTAGAPTTKPTASKTLKRQSSTISRPRPSLGPPPKQSAKDHPPTKREKEVDESFLARMMRPTAASSSKTIDKVTTPPRKPAPPVQAAKKASNPVKKTAAKTTAAEAAATTTRQSRPTASGAAAAAAEAGQSNAVSEPARSAADDAEKPTSVSASVNGDADVSESLPAPTTDTSKPESLPTSTTHNLGVSSPLAPEKFDKLIDKLPMLPDAISDSDKAAEALDSTSDKADIDNMVLSDKVPVLPDAISDSDKPADVTISSSDDSNKLGSATDSSVFTDKQSSAASDTEGESNSADKPVAVS